MPEALRVALLSLAFVGLVWGLFALVRSARSGSKAIRAAGMMAALFGWGSMRDPRNDTVAEAREGRVGKEDESGAPPDPR